VRIPRIPALERDVEKKAEDWQSVGCHVGTLDNHSAQEAQVIVWED
jgi:hypothetical protein